MKNPEVKAKEDKAQYFDYQVIKSTKLCRDITPLPIRFDKVSKMRKSVRTFKQITIQQISDVLWYAAKVKSTFQQENGYVLTHRGTPSAGARHPIDIMISNPTLLDHDFLYYYNPFEHSLNQLANSYGDIPAFLGHINEIVNITDATVIWFVAHAGRTNTKYEHAESLIWRDAGALINNIQMVCTAIGLNSCPIGSLGEPYISNFFNNQAGVFGAGGLLIG